MNPENSQIDNADQLSKHRDIYTVTRLNREVKAVLEDCFPPVWVQGELSNLAQPASGHLYFSLKDKSSQVRCAMFKNRNRHLKFSPENGMEVIIRAGISLYEGRGEYQLIVDALEPAGLGALQMAYEQLKEKLQQEGLFEASYKQSIPVYPRAIGVITSPSGAAVRDIIHVLQRRYPLAGVIIYPVPVQGKDAASRICQALEIANRRQECDVLILARGGGSLEDLWSFNDERLARAIFNSALPLVTGVGHEIDYTIADFVADQRAPTPSAAAELVTPDSDKLLGIISSRNERLQLDIRQSIRQLRDHIKRLRKGISDPIRLLQTRSQRLDEIYLHLQRRIRILLQLRRSNLRELQSGIQRFDPVRQLKYRQDQCNHLDKRLTSAIRKRLGDSGSRLKGLAQLLHSISPLATLERGYAIVTHAETGKIVKDIDSITTDDETRSEIANGYFYSKITRTEKK